MVNRIDLSGQEFGRLTVIEEAGRSKYQSILWRCKCKCGNEAIVNSRYLREGTTKSCGCLNREKSRERLLKHGDKGTRLYSIWTGMKTRCQNPNTNRSHLYYDRDITVCKAWQDYETFKSWALQNGYSDNLQIDRIDNNKGYFPENCRWVTPKEQANNQRRNHLLTYKGRTKTISEWAEEQGIKYHTLLARLNQLNWSVEKSLTKPVRGS